MSVFERQVAETAEWLSAPRFAGTRRLHTARQVAEQRGSIEVDYPVARLTAEAFYLRLRALFDARESITTFGPYSPGQAVVIKRLGIEGIYLGGWATSARGGVTEDPGADLASYPLNQVPDEASAMVRALLTADRNQQFARARMTPDQLAETPVADYRPFIIADADTGHGGDAHVRNLIRRFVEVGVPGYHIEDQKPGVKKCGHQDGKVLVAQHEQIQRLNAVRLQLDIMRVPGILVARTDAEAANLLESTTDERDQPFLLGATSLDVPTYKAVVVSVHRKLFELGVTDIRGHLMFALSEPEAAAADAWLAHAGLTSDIEEHAAAFTRESDVNVDRILDTVLNGVVERWQAHAGLKTFGQAVAHAIALRLSQGDVLEMTVSEWLRFARTAPLASAREKAGSLGLQVAWDYETARTPEGYYQVQCGLDCAIARSLACAPFADILWMETRTANLAEAKAYAEAIHAEYPDKMLAYNLSPSFNWDTTGMTDEEMRQFPRELSQLGFVFNFITYGGHQIDGLAAEEFTTALQQDGMLALARLQRRLRLLDSPYRTPQTLAGGPRLDAALMASTGRTATTKAMGKKSTQHQHTKDTELSTKVLTGWLREAARYVHTPGGLRAELRPVTGDSDVLELRILGRARERRASVVFVPLLDRRGRTVLSVREQHVFDPSLNGTPCLLLASLFLLHRYHASVVQYLCPTEDDTEQTRDLERLGLYLNVRTVPSELIVAEVNRAPLRGLPTDAAIGALVRERPAFTDQAAESLAGLSL